METLLYLAEAYFHQDWDLNAPTPVGVLEAFSSRETPGTVRSLRSELVAILAGDLTEEQLRDIWLRQGRAEWDPTRHGWATFRAWFDTVLRAAA